MFITVGFKICFDEKEKIVEFYSPGEQNRGEKKIEMKRCSRCLLPETYPNIRYNGDGVCNYCLSYTPIEYKGEEKLEELLGFYRDRGAKYDYDCVVGVSGGRDSTFTLYELVEAYDMRVLAYNYDNGFVSEQAKLDLKKLTDTLGVDLVTNLRLSPMYRVKKAEQ